MSLSGKRSGEDLPNTPQRKSNRNEQRDTSDVEGEGSEAEEEAQLVHTGVTDVFESNQAPSPGKAQELTEDWGFPIILIVARSTRDKLLTFLDKVSKGIDREDKTNVDSVPISCLSSHTSTINTTHTRIDVEMKKLLEERNRISEQLDRIQNDFHEEELIKKLGSNEAFEKLKSTRKVMSQFIAATDKTHKCYTKLTGGTTDYICKLEPNLIPNRMDKTLVSEQLDSIYEHNKHVNLNFLDHMITNTQKKITEINAILENEDSFIMAKAWRAANKSISRNQNNNYREIRTDRSAQTNYENRHTEHTDQRQTRDYKYRDRYQSTRSDEYRNDDEDLDTDNIRTERRTYLRHPNTEYIQHGNRHDRFRDRRYKPDRTRFHSYRNETHQYRQRRDEDDRQNGYEQRTYYNRRDYEREFPRIQDTYRSKQYYRKNQ